MGGRRSILEGEDDPVIVVEGEASSPFFLVCEHAGKVIPRALGSLGLEPADLTRHIAWDIGAEAVARRLAALLHAPLVLQRYSRLVYDCNRPPEAAGAIPVVSETTEIPGNRDLREEERQDRITSVYEPFRTCISRMLDERVRAGIPPVFVTVHSFTPVYKGVRRDVDLGILHDADARFADELLRLTGAGIGFDVRRNDPYGPKDGVTHTLVTQALPRGLLNVMIEIRNDLIREAHQQSPMARLLADLLTTARAKFVATAWSPRPAVGVS